MNDYDWRDDAACLDVDPEIFFPAKVRFEDLKTREELVRVRKQDWDQTEAAKRVCGSCAVRGDCLEYALQNDEEHGVWGGMDRAERKRLVRRRVA